MKKALIVLYSVKTQEKRHKCFESPIGEEHVMTRVTTSSAFYSPGEQLFRGVSG